MVICDNPRSYYLIIYSISFKVTSCHKKISVLNITGTKIIEVREANFRRFHIGFTMSTCPPQ